MDVFWVSKISAIQSFFGIQRTKIGSHKILLAENSQNHALSHLVKGIHVVQQQNRSVLA